MPYFPEEIEYGPKYYDDYYEYRSVYLPKKVLAKIPKNTLLTDKQCREYGICQSNGWKHYYILPTEPNIFNFRRPIGTNPNTGIAPNEILLKIDQLEKKREEEKKEYELYLNSNYDNENLKPFKFSKR